MASVPELWAIVDHRSMPPTFPERHHPFNPNATRRRAYVPAFSALRCFLLRRSCGSILHNPSTPDEIENNLVGCAAPRVAVGERGELRIEPETIAHVTRAAAAGPGAICPRLEELDCEWDKERTLDADAQRSLSQPAILDFRWTSPGSPLSLVVAACLLQPALRGWCPSVPFFRMLCGGGALVCRVRPFISFHA